MFCDDQDGDARPAASLEMDNPSLRMALSYGVFIAVLLARPKGLFAR